MAEAPLSLEHAGLEEALEQEEYPEPEAGIQKPLAFKDKYELLGFIGSGGQGQVYKVRDNESGEVLAAKRILLDNLDDVDALQNEARALQNLVHPGIPRYHQFYVQEDSDWGNPEYVLVTDYVEGESLYEKLSKGKRFDEEELRDIKTQVLDALRAAHSKGIVHRDIKPANIIIDDDKNVKVTDFGIAKFLGEKTRTRTLGAGSIEYMAPEQKRGEKIVPETDFYGLGMTLVALASGRDMTVNDNPHDKLKKLTYLGEPFRKSLQFLISENPEERRKGLVEKVEEVREVKEYRADSGQNAIVPVRSTKINIQLPEQYTVLEQNRYVSLVNIARHVERNQAAGLTAANLVHTVGRDQAAFFTAANLAHTVGQDQAAGLTAANLAHTVGRDQGALFTAANLAHTVGGDQFSIIPTLNIAGKIKGNQLGLVNIVYKETQGNQIGIINYARGLSDNSKQYGLINLRGVHSKKRWSSGPERWWNPEISIGFGRKKPQLKMVAASNYLL